MIDEEEALYPLVFHTQTENAYGVTETEDDNEAVIWLPKAQCYATAIADDELEAGKVYSFQVPEWLALKKGLI